MKPSTVLVWGFVLFAGPTFSAAQTAPTVPSGVPNVFNPAQGPNTSGMTPAQAQQAQRIWQLRALQARSGQGGNSSGPKRGYPQFIGSGPFGGSGMPATNSPMTQQTPAKPTSQQKAAQRRAEAKADIEARKQQIRAENEQKKQQNAKK